MQGRKYYGRRDRRQLEKIMKLKAPKNKEELNEFKRRKIEAGKQLHLSFIESVENSISVQLAEKEAKIIQSLMEDVKDHKGNVIRKGMSLEDAKKFVEKNREIERARLEKLYEREQKQKRK